VTTGIVIEGLKNIPANNIWQALNRFFANSSSTGSETPSKAVLQSEI
jgi:hypothetical protein